VGIAAGTAAVATSGCCSGMCGGPIYQRDAAVDGQTKTDGAPTDGLASDAGVGGGPLTAPTLPAAWLV